jgi:proteasome accessory factor A
VPYRAFFGTETEYAVTAFTGCGAIVPPGEVVTHLLARGATRPHLRGNGPGIWLTNGSRLYPDVGNHPEFCTPETTNPRDGVRYALAGDRLMTRLVEEVAATLPAIDRIVLRKSNVDYAGAGVTWASHENYLYKQAPAFVRAELLPHLVSRIIFTGSGGFDPLSAGLPRFVLSPRALFMRQGVALSSVEGGRALVDERERPYCAGFHRQHLTCGDSLRSHLASFLRLGTTALVVGLIEMGLNQNDAVCLADPLAALDTVARDTSLSRPLGLANGDSTTALAMQRHYLRRARSSLDVLPAWAAECCDLWEDTLERLARGADAVADRLDWAIKLAVYTDRAVRRGWHGPAAQTDDAVARWREEMFEIDTRFGQLHPPGLFDDLDRAGVLRHHVAGVHDIESAAISPPASARAAVRGKVIARLAADEGRWACAWDRIEERLSGFHLDLSDPFIEHERWVDCIVQPDTDDGLVAQIFRWSRMIPPQTPVLRELVERICQPEASAVRRRLGAYRAIDLNTRGLELRRSGRLEEAELLLRAALAIDIEVRSASHPKITHRRNNLSTVLLLQGRHEETEQELTRAWQIVGSRYDLTSARILIVRLALAMIRREPPDVFIGQLKTQLMIQPLPDFADVVLRSELALVFDALELRLDADELTLLKAIVAVTQTDKAVEALGELRLWREALPQPLDREWPTLDGESGNRVDRLESA